LSAHAVAYYPSGNTGYVGKKFSLRLASERLQQGTIVFYEFEQNLLTEVALISTADAHARMELKSWTDPPPQGPTDEGFYLWQNAKQKLGPSLAILLIDNAEPQ